jgi:DNA-binding GntR family transcriptional regulator
MDTADSGPLPFEFTLDRKRPAIDQIYEALKAAIVSVRLPPGTSISENRICRHIGVSRTPIRAAMIRLVEDELIDVYPQLGSFVAPIKLSTIRESHFVRKALELAVLREAAKIWTPALTERARAMIGSQRVAVTHGDVDLFHIEDEAFHRNISLSAGLPGVWNAIQSAKARVDRVHRLAAIEGRLPVVIIEHEAVVAALDAGRTDEAAARLEYHLDRILDLLGMLRERYAAYFVD